MSSHISNTDTTNKGTSLPIAEEFYSIQGEGFHTGSAAYFIRLSGCDIGCCWCDAKDAWVPEPDHPVDINEVINRAASGPCKSVVITGGEPLKNNLNLLCKGLKEKNIKTFLETSGSENISGTWDWICLSPKIKYPPLPVFYTMAHELKVIIFEKSDFEWAEKNAEKMNDSCLLYLQPEWSRFKKNCGMIVEYIKQHPKWNISLQTHKFMRIP